jgi:uncharacterized protein
MLFRKPRLPYDILICALADLSSDRAGDVMSSNVYFVHTRARGDSENTVTKIRRLFDRAGFDELLEWGDLTAVKIHFGERGSDSFIHPLFVRQVVDKIRACGAKPFLTDTRTLYSGSRSNAVDHLVTAIEHGFDYAVAGAPVIVADGLSSGHYTEVEISKKHFKTVKIAGDVASADSMIVLSHFKGHILSGFGGAIKNLAMGCAPVAGKKEMHCARAQIDREKCVGCGSCGDVCPAGAISMDDDTAQVNPELCPGCGECLTVCPGQAIEFDWDVEIPPFMERMAEYAYGAISAKKNKVGYYNFLLNITPDCDCVPWSDARVVPDIGILASRDPIAIDRASFDLVNAQPGMEQSFLKQNFGRGEDKFKGMWEFTDGYRQISYGEEIGLGSSDYRLIEI